MKRKINIATVVQKGNKVAKTVPHMAKKANKVAQAANLLELLIK